MPFKKGPTNPSGSSGRPQTGAVPEGGYGSGGVPGRAQRMSAKKSKSKGGWGSAGKRSAKKPSGGWGTHGKPMTRKSRVGQRMGSYANDGMAEPKSPIPKDQATGRFNLPRGKFTYS